MTMADFTAEADARRKRQRTVVTALRKLGIAATRDGASSVSLSLEDAELALARLERDWHDDWEKISRDRDGNTILRHRPTKGMYRILPVEES